MDNENKDKEKAELELEFIKNIIQDSRKTVEDSGISAIVWGVLITIALTYTFIGSIYKLGESVGLFWLVIIIIGWIFSYFNAKNRDKRPKTFAVKIQNALWFASGISMTIIGIVSSVQFKLEPSDFIPFPYIINYMAISPIISLIMGAAYYVTGIINYDKFITRLAYGWWIGSIIMFYWKSYFTFLMFAAMIILFQILPNIYYYKKHKRVAL